ncbi:MAG: hypothetical protein R3185_05140 [Candidatus Thermoplasmatota archaeon]|nr:hypothetical protein [Candidatus Thermoplasmatota archaeon]
MAKGERLRITWRLEVETDHIEALERALAPEAHGHHTLAREDGRLLAEGEGGVGESLHTLDDLLACLTAGVEGLEAGEPS